MCSGYPLTAQTNESDTPVLPPVYSTTWPPRFKRPSRSAASIMASAIRSFILPVGCSLSIFSRRRAPFAGTTRLNGTRGVSPMQSRMFIALLLHEGRDVFDHLGRDVSGLRVFSAGALALAHDEEVIERAIALHH